MPVTVRFNPTVNSEQAQVIPNATCRNDGVMSKEQACQLHGLGTGSPCVVWANSETWDDVKTKVANVGGVAIIIVPYDDYDRVMTGTDNNLDGLYFFGFQGLPIFHTRLKGATITIDPTATFLADFSLRSFNVIWQSSAPVGLGAPFYMELSNGAWVHTNATDAAFECSSSPSNGPCTVALYGDAAITAAGAAPVFHAVDTLGLLEVLAFDSTTLSANAIVGGAASATEVVAAATAQVVKATVFSGAGTFLFVVLPELYTPANLPDWNNVDPLTVGNALDRIAAKITPVT